MLLINKQVRIWKFLYLGWTTNCFVRAIRPISASTLHRRNPTAFRHGCCAQRCDNDSADCNVIVLTATELGEQW